MCYNLGLVRDKPLGAPAYVKLIYLYFMIFDCTLLENKLTTTTTIVWSMLCLDPWQGKYQSFISLSLCAVSPLLL